MRRARGGAGLPEAAASQTPPSSRLHGDDETAGARSAPSAVKPVLMVALALTLFAAIVLVGNARGGTQAVELRASSGSNAGASGGRGTDLRRSFRRLSMMGFEEGSGQDGEWRTCRAYEESTLGPHKKVRVFRRIHVVQIVYCA